MQHPDALLQRGSVSAATRSFGHLALAEILFSGGPLRWAAQLSRPARPACSPALSPWTHAGCNSRLAVAIDAVLCGRSLPASSSADASNRREMCATGLRSTPVEQQHTADTHGHQRSLCVLPARCPRQLSRATCWSTCPRTFSRWAPPRRSTRSSSSSRWSTCSASTPCRTRLALGPGPISSRSPQWQLPRQQRARGRASAPCAAGGQVRAHDVAIQAARCVARADGPPLWHRSDNLNTGAHLRHSVCSRCAYNAQEPWPPRRPCCRRSR